MRGKRYLKTPEGSIIEVDAEDLIPNEVAAARGIVGAAHMFPAKMVKASVVFLNEVEKMKFDLTVA